MGATGATVVGARRVVVVVGAAVVVVDSTSGRSGAGADGPDRGSVTVVVSGPRRGRGRRRPRRHSWPARCRRRAAGTAPTTRATSSARDEPRDDDATGSVAPSGSVVTSASVATSWSGVASAGSPPSGREDPGPASPPGAGSAGVGDERHTAGTQGVGHPVTQPGHGQKRHRREHGLRSEDGSLAIGALLTGADVLVDHLHRGRGEPQPRPGAGPDRARRTAGRRP